MVALGKPGSSTTFGRGTGGSAGAGPEGSAGVLAFLLAGGFLVALATGGGGLVTGESGREVDVDGGSYTMSQCSCRLRNPQTYLRSSRRGYHS